MRGNSSIPDISVLLRTLAKWLLLLSLLSAIVGSLVALFLWLIDVATKYRRAHEWLLYLLPVAGIIIYFLYKLWGKNSEAGNNLIIDEIHKPGGGVPARMTPLVLITTIITHLFGGSAGREGTAVQMGGSIAGAIGRWCKFTNKEIPVLLMAGIAAGFGAVFGTPFAGAIFAVEVLTRGRVRYHAIVPCLVAALLADVTTSAWGIHHTQYHIASVVGASFLHFDVGLLLKTALAGVAFGLAAFFFAELSHAIKGLTKRLVKPEWIIPVIGGVIIIGLCYLLGTTDYIGLGVAGKYANSVSILNAFHAGGATNWSWLWKIILTAVTLGTGFKGGEVTPLFFIGATLGNVIAIHTGAPIDIFAALGFIAVFAGATNTPIACTVMGVELFGAEYELYFAVACFIAYYFSGSSGIYTTQRLSGGADTLHELRERRNLRILGMIKKYRSEYSSTNYTKD